MNSAADTGRTVSEILCSMEEVFDRSEYSGPRSAGNNFLSEPAGCVLEPTDKTGIADKQTAVSLAVYRIRPVAPALQTNGGRFLLFELFERRHRRKRPWRSLRRPMRRDVVWARMCVCMCAPERLLRIAAKLFREQTGRLVDPLSQQKNETTRAEKPAQLGGKRRGRFDSRPRARGTQATGNPAKQRVERAIELCDVVA